MSKLTKEQLQGMSYLEINRAICDLCKGEFDGDCGSSVYYVQPVTGHSKSFNCTDCNDIMPLAFEHRIGLQPARNEWQAFAATADFYNDENPLRALACCLILVLQEKS